MGVHRAAGRDLAGRGGYIFQGRFLSPATLAEVPDDSYIVVGAYDDTTKGRSALGVLYHLRDGVLKEIGRAEGRDWPLRMRADLVKLVGEAVVSERRNPALAAFTDKELLAEIRRRALEVFMPKDGTDG